MLYSFFDPESNQDSCFAFEWHVTLISFNLEQCLLTLTFLKNLKQFVLKNVTLSGFVYVLKIGFKLIF